MNNCSTSASTHRRVSPTATPPPFDVTRSRRCPTRCRKPDDLCDDWRRRCTPVSSSSNLANTNSPPTLPPARAPRRPSMDDDLSQDDDDDDCDAASTAPSTAPSDSRSASDGARSLSVCLDARSETPAQSETASTISRAVSVCDKADLDNDADSPIALASEIVSVPVPVAVPVVSAVLPPHSPRSTDLPHFWHPKTRDHPKTAIRAAFVRELLLSSLSSSR